MQGEPCEGNELDLEAADFYRDLTFQTPTELLRRVSMSLLSRSPSPAQLDAVRAGGMPAFEEALDTLFEHSAFLDRVKRDSTTSFSLAATTPFRVLSSRMPFTQRLELGDSTLRTTRVLANL